MAKLSLNRQMIEDRLIDMRDCLIEMYGLAKLPEEDFLADVRNWAACETFLRHALEAIFDIGRHILARIGRFQAGLEYKSIARGLGDNGVISQKWPKGWSPSLATAIGWFTSIKRFHLRSSTTSFRTIFRT